MSYMYLFKITNNIISLKFAAKVQQMFEIYKIFLENNRFF